MLAQDIIGNTPIVPIAGETYEGLYVMPDGNCEVFMEADYIKRDVIDLITGQLKNRVLNDQETNYIHIVGPKSGYQIYGHLTYNKTQVGVNLNVSLVGTLFVKFKDRDGIDQVIKIQLPDFVLANFIQADNKPCVALINGNMVLIDERNMLKSVIIIKGLIKKTYYFQEATYEPNMGQEDLIDGKIYKFKPGQKKSTDARPGQLDNLNQIPDVIDYELANVSGQGITDPLI